MEKSTLFRCASLALVSAASMSMLAQNPIVIEAEDEELCIESFEAKDVADWSSVEGCEASGLKSRGMDNAHKGAYMLYVVEAPEAGTYDLEIAYVTMNTRWAEFKINDQVSTVVCFDEFTGNWNGTPGEVNDEDGNPVMRPGIAKKTIQVYLDKGENYMKVSAIFGWSKEEGRDQPYSPNFDYFKFTKSATEIARPADWTEDDQIWREAENFDGKTGNGEGGKTGTGYSADGRGKFGASAVPMTNSLSYNVNIAEEGVYKITIGYATMQRRWLGVKVNQQEPTYLCFNEYTGDWDGSKGINVHQALVYLKAGANTITLGNYTKTGSYASEHGDSPNLDYFSLDRVNYDMEEPEVEKLAYKFSLAEVAKWSSSDLDVALLRDHDEYTIAKAAGNSATVTLEFPFAVAFTGYAWSTTNNTDDWKVELSNDGQTWSEAPTYRARDIKSGIVTTSLPDPYADKLAYTYLRLVMNGNETVELGDFCVFGNPLVSEENHNPEGLMPVGFEDYDTTHQGFDEGWGEVISKIFDGLNSDKYTVRSQDLGDKVDDIAVTVYLDKDVNVKSYLLATHYSTGYYSTRCPGEWSLQAYDYDSDEFVDIDTRDGMNFAVPGSTMIMDVADNDMMTDTYKLVIRKRSGMDTHLAAFQLYANNFSTNDSSTGIEDIVSEDGFVAIAGTNGAIEIASSEAKAYAVYSISGMTVANGVVNGNATVKAAAGLYIVKVGERAVKVLVK